MKNKLTLLFSALLILVSLSIQAQRGSFYEKHFISLSFDPKMLVKGAYSYDTTPVLDLTIELKVQKDWYEIGIIGEIANLNPQYLSIGFIYNRIIPVFNSNKVETLTGLEGLIIQRDFPPTERQRWLTLGINNEIRYIVSDYFSVGLVLNTKWRRDISSIRHSGFIKLSFTHLRVIGR